jgi:hypothetical protein
MPIILPGFKDVQLNIATNLCSVLMLASLFNVLSHVLIVALRATDRFLVGEVVTLAGSLASLLLGSSIYKTSQASVGGARF